MDEENHTLLHELRAEVRVSLKHIEETLDEIKSDIKSFNEFRLDVEKYMAGENARREEGKRLSQKIAFAVSLLVSSLIALLQFFLERVS